MRWNAIALLAIGIWGSPAGGGSPVCHRTVPGTFVRVGGLATGLPFALPGTITARAATGETITATVGRNGRFKLSPGTYCATGRGPLTQSGQMVCTATAELQVIRGKRARPVLVVCSIP